MNTAFTYPALIELFFNDPFYSRSALIQMAMEQNGRFPMDKSTSPSTFEGIFTPEIFLHFLLHGAMLDPIDMDLDDLMSIDLFKHHVVMNEDYSSMRMGRKYTLAKIFIESKQCDNDELNNNRAYHIFKSTPPALPVSSLLAFFKSSFLPVPYALLPSASDNTINFIQHRLATEGVVDCNYTNIKQTTEILREKEPATDFDFSETLDDDTMLSADNKRIRYMEPVSTPTNITWPDIHITFVDYERVKITFGAEVYEKTYKQLGFADFRTTNASPDKKWRFLAAIACHYGQIKWGSRLKENDHNTAKKKVSEISKMLQKAFPNLVGQSAFKPYNNYRGYQTDFSLSVLDSYLETLKDHLELSGRRRS